MKTLGIINCFLGQWPDWGDLFIESCRYNPTVDFFLFSDCAAPRQGFPPNVKLVDLDLQRFNVLASERLGMEVALRKPYKLIDFKPAWGVIFEDYIKDYDFWGFCDLDVILGNIRTLLTEELLDEYDIFSCRREFLSGHFLLFRNTHEIKHLYERSSDWFRIANSEEVFNFDECGHGLHPKLLRGAKFADIASQGKIDSMMHVLARTPQIRVYMETICGEQLFMLLGGSADKVLKIRYDRGTVFDLMTGREPMYFHLQFLKLERRVFVPRWKEIPPAFLLTRRGVFWIVEQELGQRLASALHRTGYFLVRPIRLGPKLLRWWLYRVLRMLAFLRPKPRTAS